MPVTDRLLRARLDDAVADLIEAAIASQTYDDLRPHFEAAPPAVQKEAIAAVIRLHEENKQPLSDRAWNAALGPGHVFLLRLLGEWRSFVGYSRFELPEPGALLEHAVVPLRGRRRGERLHWFVEQPTEEHLDIEYTGEWDRIGHARVFDREGRAIAVANVLMDDLDDLLVPCDFFDSTGLVVHPEMRRQGLGTSVAHTLAALTGRVWTTRDGRDYEEVWEFIQALHAVEPSV
jgi:GNAT superfamily N-acetyltransferase